MFLFCHAVLHTQLNTTQAEAKTQTPLKLSSLIQFDWVVTVNQCWCHFKEFNVNDIDKSIIIKHHPKLLPSDSF